MLSAGNNGYVNPQQQQNQQAGPGMPVPIYTPLQWNNPFGTGVNFKLTGDISDPEVQDYLGSRLGWEGGGMIVGGVLQGMNAYFASETANDQYELGVKSFDVQQTIAGYQREVEIQKLALAERGQDLAREMQEKELENREKLAKLSADTQLRLEQINVKGQNERAEMLAAVIPAFSRDGYFGGSPFSIV
jgi:hypothetical protein